MFFSGFMASREVYERHVAVDQQQLDLLVEWMEDRFVQQNETLME